MADIKVTEGPKEPCDRPAPGEGDEVSHKHDDGRVCAWNDQEGSWWTVAATPKDVEFTVSVETSDGPLLPPEPVLDQKQRGIYPKFLVRRADGRDMPGGDRHDATQGYMVLDPIFDPAARVAYAVYAKAVRELGYGPYADDLEANLVILNDMASQAMEAPEYNGGSPARSLRIIASWVYDATPEGYEGLLADDGLTGPATAAQMSRYEMRSFENGDVGIEDMVSWGDGSEPILVVMPNA